MALYALSLGWGPKAPILSVGCLWLCAAEVDVVTYSAHGDACVCILGGEKMMIPHVSVTCVTAGWGAQKSLSWNTRQQGELAVVDVGDG